MMRARIKIKLLFKLKQLFISKINFFKMNFIMNNKSLLCIYKIASLKNNFLSAKNLSNFIKDNPKIIFNKVNKMIESKQFGQAFAVIHLYNRQYLIHNGDILAVKYPIQADIGERIKIEKCLLFGNDKFTLIGRPILNRDLIQVEATVVEKTMTQTYMDMLHKPRSHGWKSYQFKRYPLTMLRINDINICHLLNTHQEQIN